MVDEMLPQDVADPYALIAEMKDMLAQFPHIDWRQFDGTFLAELFLGLKFNRKVRRIINRTFSLACTRPIWVGSRGSGKSMCDAVILFLVWMFLDFDGVNVGGSELQAQNVYAYFQAFLGQFRETLLDWGAPEFAPALALTKETMGRTVRAVTHYHVPVLLDPSDGVILPPDAFVGAPLAKDTRAFVAVLAASQKQVRGPHAGSARRGGILIMDEEAEIPGDIAHAARYMVNTAVPAIIMRSSTNHNAVGTFAEDVADPESKGLELTSTSIFDCCARCPHSITTQAQWDDIAEGRARAPGDLHKTVRHLPVVRPDCSACPRPEYFRDGKHRMDPNTGLLKEVLPPLCGGAAAFTENGHIPFDGPGGVLQQFDERPNDEDFAVELCAAAPSSSGMVIKDRAALDRAVKPDEDCRVRTIEEGGAEMVIVIDWGLAGTCATGLLQNVFVTGKPEGLRVLIEALNLGKQSDQVVYDQCGLWRDQYGVHEVWANSSHPYCNYNLTLMVFHVNAVKFAESKALGVGSVNGHLEHDALWIPESLKPLVHKQLAGWRKSDTGQIVKKDDHYCDMLLCGCLKYRDLVASVPAYQSAAVVRDAVNVNREAQATIPVVSHGGLRSGDPNTSLPTLHQGPQVGPGGRVVPRAREVGRASPVTGSAAPRPAPSFSQPHRPAQTAKAESTMDRLMREAREAADRGGKA